jgi:hypothetical protein
MSTRYVKYLATINTPGYLPQDDDPPVFDTAAEAWAYLADERERDEDDSADDSAADWPYTATLAELHDAAGHNNPPSMGEGTIYGSTPGYDGSHDLGLAYSVSEVEDLEDHSVTAIEEDDES